MPSPMRTQLWSIAAACGAIVAALIAVGTMSGAAESSGETAHAAAPSEWPDRIVLGLVPTEGSADVSARFKPLADHLQRVLGVPVETRTASDYAGMITAMGQKHVDVAYMGPKSYVEAADRAGVQAVAMEKSTDGQPGYHGVIIARKDSGLKDVAGLRAKTIAFVDPNSTSGYLVPLMHFRRDLKVDPRAHCREVRFAGSHQAAILAVKNGSVDAGATNDLDMARIVSSGQAAAEDFVILWKSEPIPGAPVAVRRDLPESLKAAITGALMSVGDDADVLAAIGNGGYVYASDASYDVMRYLMRLSEDTAADKAPEAGKP